MALKFVVIGHVDTGKSTLCGHLLYKTGYITEHQVSVLKAQAERDKMSKWCWARVLDCYREEQLKGKTHEYDVVEFKTEKQTYVLVDTPGHLDFVREMIAGLHDVQIAVLLVSAVESEFNSSFDRGMLKEHLILARAKGIRKLIVCVNKMDSVDWSQESYDKVLSKLRIFLKEINWKSSNIQYLAVSAWSGQGLVEAPVAPDFRGQLNLLDALNAAGREIKTPALTSTLTSTLTVANTLILKFRVINSKIPISAGYVCVLHHQDDEVESTVIKVKDSTFIMSGQTGTVIVSLNRPVSCYKGQRLIARRNTETVGYATVEGRKLRT